MKTTAGAAELAREGAWPSVHARHWDDTLRPAPLFSS
jgi:hypothetical protein